MERPNAWKNYDDEALAMLEAVSVRYRDFLDHGKTERECVTETVAAAQKAGYVDLEQAIAQQRALKPGDKVYVNCMGKAVMLFHLGEEPLEKGVNIVGAHIDSPRIDIKQNPFYEADDIAYADTHYYGGIKKYQWTTIPMELRGIVCRMTENGVESVDVRIGDKPGDPVFVITDLLIHLATEQMGKTMMKGIEAENMNVLVGSKPSKSDIETSDKIKLWVMEFLNKEYGITEEDFLSAELTCVPAFKASDVGFDRSFIGAYGHDDRVCSYPAATALLDLKETPKKTSMVILVDKEEIGSDGVTGMQSHFFDTLVADLCRADGTLFEECIERSTCLSADVCNAFDPNYPNVSERRNDARVNCGVALVKYTGARGKSGSSDATAELMGKMRYQFHKNHVIWQTGQLGKVDQGGGGTVAMFMANRNIDTVDCGVPVLSMHAPFEVIAKLDLFAAYNAFKAFYQMEQ